MVRRNKEKKKELFFSLSKDSSGRNGRPKVTPQYLQCFHSLTPALPSLLQSYSGHFPQCSNAQITHRNTKYHLYLQTAQL